MACHRVDGDGNGFAARWQQSSVGHTHQFVAMCMKRHLRRRTKGLGDDHDGFKPYFAMPWN